MAAAESASADKPDSEPQSADSDNTARRRRPPTPVIKVDPRQMLAQLDAEMRKYEIRYEMTSDEMATLLELDAIRPTAEILKWYSSYQGARLIRDRTRAAGTAGTTA